MKITDFVHLLIKNHINESSNVIDATCGNGNDTFFLASICKNGTIEAYDIQRVAIEKTKEKCQAFSNIIYHHESFDKISPHNVDLVLFNLGYLPNGDKTITTTSSITLKTVKKLIDAYPNNPNMLILITVYPGHNEGKLESDALNAYLKEVDSKELEVTKIIPFNQLNSPYIFMINKKHKC